MVVRAPLWTDATVELQRLPRSTAAHHIHRSRTPASLKSTPVAFDMTIQHTSFTRQAVAALHIDRWAYLEVLRLYRLHSYK